MALLALALAVGALVYLCCWCLSRLLRKSHAVPGPPAWPIIGNAHYFLGNTQDILTNYQKLMDTYPSPFRLSFGKRFLYFVYEPEHIKTVMLSPATIEKGDMYKFAQPFIGTGLITAPAAKWRTHRKLINPAFNQRILESFVKVFSKQSQIMVQSMESEISNKNEFDIFYYVSLCVLDIVGETTMGISLEAQLNKSSLYIRSIKRYIEIVYKRMLKIWLHPDFIFERTELGKEHRECLENINALSDSVIQRKKQDLKDKTRQEKVTLKQTRKAFLDLLMELSQEGAKFTDKDLRDEVNTMILAGNDTMTTVNCFVLLMLASHPEIQDKVYDELHEIYEGKDLKSVPVKHEELHRMKYLERVIKETMRLFPIGVAIARTVTNDLKIGDCTLTKGSVVALGLLKVHRSAEYWQNPLEFNPDRFLPEECAKRHSYCYVPFSEGPRSCIGINFAMMAMKTLIATVLRKYRVKKDNIVPIKDIRLKADSMLKPVTPITIRIEKRTFSKK